MDTKDIVFSAVVSTLLITSGWAFRKMQLVTDTYRIERADRDQVSNIAIAPAQRNRDGDALIDQNHAQPMCSHVYTLAALPADVRDRMGLFMDANGDTYLMPNTSRFAVNQNSRTLIPR
ncbi:hypothetical protein F5X68DRAFT_197978 [Plectosphaerella plurivora]|uniref:Uncharacterized protein n=1 Tax=Plectosphaerella plurivora TaxID=936078 RepID=A0A9P9AH51_9PEZI|nr:hypothetical protein F5X68DRAFT_197978 [Plectosphaerella plurivora]